MIIYFIRHGKTYANQMRIYTGTTDLPVTDEGKEEIRKLKESGVYPSLREVNFCFISALSRTKETCDIIFPNIKTQKEPLINEWCFGDFEMKSFDDLKKREDYQNWINDETKTVCPPKGESEKMFEERSVKGFLNIVKEAEKKGLEEFAIVGHGGVISQVLHQICMDNRNHYERIPKNGCGVVLEIKKENNEYVGKQIGYIGDEKPIEKYDTI